MQNSKPRQPYNKWLVFIGIPAQIGGIIYLFYWIGTKIDAYWHVKEAWGSKLSTLLGVFLAVYQVIREVKKISKDE